jgi:hypothetical protein
MNPPNGWGDYEGAVGVLQEMLRQCYAHPDAILSVS